MSKENGELRTCDRCGKTQFFKTIGDGERDGGYTRWNKFEEPVGWTMERDIGDLCPECSSLYEKMKNEFLEKFKNLEQGEQK